MRRTIRLRPEAFELAVRVARETGQSLEAVVTAALLAADPERTDRRKVRARITIPTSGRGGLQPGINLDKSSALDNV